jgi:hypothetical protein
MNDHNPLHMPDFRTADERTEHIKNNADHFTVTFRYNLKNITREFKELDFARLYAKFAANEVGKPVLIYAVLGPHDSWIETVNPHGKRTIKYKPRNTAKTTRTGGESV